MRISVKKILYFELICVFAIPFCTSVLGLPRNLLYIMDLINVFLFIFGISRNKLYQQSNNYITITMLSLALCGLIGYMFFGTSFIQYLWGLRNILRFFVFLLNCYYCFDISDIKIIWNCLYKLFFFNIIFGTVQYFVMGISGDLLGGTFGTLMGASGYLVALLALIITYTTSLYVCNKISLVKLLLTYAGILYLSILAELKVMYLILVLVMFFTIMVTRPNIKTIMIVMCAFFALVFGLRLLSVLNPTSFSYVSSLDNLMYYLTNSYTAEGGFSRTDSIPKINELFFKDSILKRIFGYGLGQCDYSNIPILNSLFYQKYGSYNYRYFFYAMTYLEMGATGLVIYAYFYVKTLICTVKYRLDNYREFKIMTVMNIVIIIIMAIYNYTLRSDPGYIWMLACSVPLILKKSYLKENKKCFLNE